MVETLREHIHSPKLAQDDHVGELTQSMMLSWML
jgi:hypothetical protein